MRKYLFAIAAFAVAAAGTMTDAAAYSGDGGTLRVKAGVSQPIRRIINCVTPGGAMPGISGLADHGTITVKEGTSNACHNPKQPTVLVIYTPNPGFVGKDRAVLYIGAPYEIDLIVQ